MPTPPTAAELAGLTPYDIAAAAAAPQSATVDGQSATARPIAEMIAAAEYAKAQDAAAAGPNPYGGPRSAWNMTRPAKAVPPGAA